jgi:DNA-binding HxlR family transcriptional regulator
MENQVNEPKGIFPGNGSNVRNPKECSIRIMAIRDALDILSGKWKIPIIGVLGFGKMRFKELQREVNGITGKMLSKELRDLEINKLVTRTVLDTKPVTVEYELTDYGLTLGKVIAELHNWGLQHRHTMMKEE